MSKLIRGTHHVALKCAGTAEFQKTVAFYTEVLGLEPVRSWGEGTGSGIMLSTGNSLIEIFANGEDHPGEGAIRHFALATDDVDACAAASGRVISYRAALYDKVRRRNRRYVLPGDGRHDV